MPGPASSFSPKPQECLVKTHDFCQSVEGVFHKYSVRNFKLAANLLQACNRAVVKPVSGCVRIACSSLMITSLLHASCQQTLWKFILNTSYPKSLTQVVSTSSASLQRTFNLLDDILKKLETGKNITTS